METYKLSFDKMKGEALQIELVKKEISRFDFFVKRLLFSIIKNVVRFSNA